MYVRALTMAFPSCLIPAFLAVESKRTHVLHITFTADASEVRMLPAYGFRG